MTWNREKIYRKIVDVADKYGSRNPQQLAQLKFVLRKCDASEVFNGLYKVFLDEDGNVYARQELAGTLLYDICPKADIELTATIRQCLSTYNLSVEQLPWYLEDIHEKQEVLESIDSIASTNLTPREKHSLRTMKWWIEGYTGRRNDQA